VSYSNRRIALVLALALAIPLVGASPALADDVTAHVNSVRSDSLPVVAGADRLAGTSAVAQATAGTLFHADLSGLLGACDSVGEIVGTAPDIPGVFSAFRQSSRHWSILTNPAWTALGTGQATGADGMVYVSVVFCRQRGGATSSAASPPTAGRTTVRTAAVARATAEVSAKVPMLYEGLPAIGARRAQIRAWLDPQAKSLLPDWYVGICGNDDRARALEGNTSGRQACPRVT
jgi:hypothetical protein